MQVLNVFWRCILVMILLGDAFIVQSQSDDEQLRQLEKYIENTDQAGDYNDLAELFNYGVNNRLNLNKADPFELLSLNILNPLQVRAIVQHRMEFGIFVSLLELQTIDGISMESIRALIPLITIEDHSLDVKKLKDQMNQAKKEMLGSMSTSRPLSKGYTELTSDSVRFYPGSPYSYQLRLRANYKNEVVYGFSAEKDAGEDFFVRSNLKGFDFYSVHFFINKRGIVRKVALGDFQAGFGQGLTMSSGLGFGKSALVLNVKRFNTGLRPYRSLNENEFLRGCGVTVGYKNIESTIFVSRHRIDAYIDTLNSGFSQEIYTRSFLTDGYHRTALEISKEKTTLKTIAGNNLTYKGKNLSIGLTSIYNSFDKPLRIEDRIYNRYYFSEKIFFKTGLHFDYYLKNMNFFGESVTGSGNSNGYIIGAYISWLSSIDIVIANRYYSKSFIWYNTNAFSENSNPVNEYGTYVGINIRLLKKLMFSSYFDRYKLPWYSFTADGKGRGADVFTELNFKPNKTSLLYVRFRNKQELKNTSFEKYNQLDWIEKKSLRVHSEMRLSPKLVLRTRIEFSKFKSHDNYKTNGNLFYIELVYKKTHFPLSFNSRIAWFTVSDYDSRIYAVENDVQYSWSVTGFSGSGSKFYFLTRYKFRKNINVQCRYAFTDYYDKKNIGSDYNMVISNKVHQINILISYGFM